MSVSWANLQTLKKLDVLLRPLKGMGELTPNSWTASDSTCLSLLHRCTCRRVAARRSAYSDQKWYQCSTWVPEIPSPTSSFTCTPAPVHERWRASPCAWFPWPAFFALQPCWAHPAPLHSPLRVQHASNAPSAATSLVSNRTPCSCCRRNCSEWCVWIEL